jgi:betaine-aldehyde dehydrogenase
MGPDVVNFSVREPFGVVGRIIPFNHPFMFAAGKSGAPLAAGNTVVLKPSDTTPETTLLLAEVAAEFLPPGVLNVITGDRNTGRALVEHPIPQMVAITGSVRAGMEVAGSAARDLKRVHLELGGKAPVVVFDDADVAAAAEAIAIAGYFNAGQDCTAATRVLAGPGVHSDFVAALTEQAEGAKVGLPDDEEALFGPVNNASQLERVTGFLSRLPDHATVNAGGSRVTTMGDGYFVEPTVVSGLRQDDEVIQNEIFGPVITVQQFSSEEEALAWANGVQYGLASSVWTADFGRAMRMSRRMDFGCVWINTHIPLVAEMPHGGFKHSGYGKDLSLYGLEDYTRIKHVMAAIDS